GGSGSRAIPVGIVFRIDRLVSVFVRGLDAHRWEFVRRATNIMRKRQLSHLRLEWIAIKTRDHGARRGFGSAPDDLTIDALASFRGDSKTETGRLPRRGMERAFEEDSFSEITPPLEEKHF